MQMSVTCYDRPLIELERQQQEEADWLANLPVCSNCGEPIQDEHYYVINDENICPECMNNDFRVENDALEQ